MAGQKICVVGAGRVGATLIQNLANRNMCSEILVCDNNEGVAQGMCLDIMQSAYIAGSTTTVRVLKDNTELQGCTALFFCAGSPRLPGMTRSDLLLANARVVSEVFGAFKPYLKNTIVVMVTNPLDAMLYLTRKILDVPREQVLGMAGVLDSARMAHYIREKLQLTTSEIIAPVIGSHGDLMVPLGRFATVGGIPLPDLVASDVIADIENRTRNGGAEIVGYLKNGSAFYAPARAAAVMAEAILKDRGDVLCASVLLEGEYGFDDVCIGVPIVLGASGCRKILKYKLNDTEKAAFEQSVASVAELITILKNEQMV